VNTDRSLPGFPNVMICEAHVNVLRDLAFVKTPPNATMDTVNALERCLVAAAVLGSESLVDLAALYASLTGGPDGGNFEASPVGSFLRLACTPGTPRKALLDAMTNVLGHGTPDGYPDVGY
jgi:hypothetical protein